MSSLQELRDAIAHVTAVTGDDNAWRRGLTPADLGAISAAVIDPAAVSDLLAKIRAGNPTLFDTRTGAPRSPASPGGGQRGEGADAMKKAEADLAQQNSAAAQLDLHVIAAIFSAHANTVEGAERLRALQQEIEQAVRSRTDLDTAAGARDFQRFLIGKLREIGAVVESAGLDDTSKAAMASAWTALYNTGTSTEAAAPDSSGPSTDPTAAAPATIAAGTAAPLLPYGSDLGDDPLLDSLLAPETAPAGGGVPAVPVSPMATPTAPAGAPMPLPTLPTLPAMTGAPMPAVGPAELPRTEPDELPLDDWLDTEVPLDEPSAEPPADEVPAEEPLDPTAGTAVQLPDGTSVQAPSSTIAAVLRSALAGTPIVDAYRAEGIAVPPPGTPVANPVAARHVLGGDIGMFMDRQALAVSADRALFGGRIQPVSSVGGPSFLGWLHPPGPDSTAAAPPSTPMQGGTPPPTRPATAAAR